MKKYNFEKNKSKDCIGDLRKNNKNYEIKISNGGKNNNKFNYVQLRVNHKCCYILTAYYITESNLNINGELFIFLIEKEDLIKLIYSYGCYAHGTKNKLGEITIEDLNNENNDKEYALRIKYNDKCFKELLNYRINEIII